MSKRINYYKLKKLYDSAVSWINTRVANSRNIKGKFHKHCAHFHWKQTLFAWLILRMWKKLWIQKWREFSDMETFILKFINNIKIYFNKTKIIRSYLKFVCRCLWKLQLKELSTFKKGIGEHYTNTCTESLHQHKQSH